MKTKFLLLATALFCLASCDKAEFDNNVADLGGNSSVTPSGDVYTIEIEGSDPATKVGKAALQSMGYASLSGTGREAKPKATLYKNKVEVSGASYTWSLINSGGSYISLEKASEQQAILTGKTIKSQANLVHVKGTDGVGSAETDVPVVVTDNLTVDWDKPSMTLISGEQDQNTVITNHAESSVTVSCPSNCKIGKTGSNLGTSDITVTTDPNGKATVYVQYTGTSDASLTLKAASGSHSASSSITAKKQESHTVTFNFNPDIKNLVTQHVSASQTQKWVNASQQIVIWDKGSASCGGAAFVDFFSYTGWTLSEVNSQFNSSTKDARILKTTWETTSKTIYVGIPSAGSYVEVYEGEQQSGSPALKWSGTPSVSLSAGSSTTPSNYPSGYNSSKFKAVYELTVNSDMSLTVTIQ